MGQDSVIFFALFLAFVFYITLKGQLKQYLTLFSGTGATVQSGLAPTSPGSAMPAPVAPGSINSFPANPQSLYNPMAPLEQPPPDWSGEIP